MSRKATRLTSFTAGTYVHYGKTLPENKEEKVEIKEKKAILIKKKKL